MSSKIVYKFIGLLLIAAGVTLSLSVIHSVYNPVYFANSQSLLIPASSLRILQLSSLQCVGYFSAGCYLSFIGLLIFRSGSFSSLKSLFSPSYYLRFRKKLIDD